MLRLFVAFLVGFSCQQAQANDGFYGFERSLNNREYGHTKVQSPEPVRAGTLSQRFEVRSGDCGSDSGWSDCENDRERSEVASVRKFRMNEEIWLAYSIYFPRNYWDSNNFRTTVGQIHQNGGPSGVSNGLPSNSGLLQMVTKGGFLSMIYHELSGTPTNIIDEDITTNLASLETIKGKWTDILLHIKFSKEDGFLEVFLNGKKKYDLRQGQKFSKQGIEQRKATNFIKFEPKDFYFKYGIYRSFISKEIQRSGKGVPTQVIYYDEIRVGSSREEVDINNYDLTPID